MAPHEEGATSETQGRANAQGVRVFRVFYPAGADRSQDPGFVQIMAE